MADHLAQWGYQDLIPKVVLMTSEIATNAVVHAGKPFTVGVEDLGDGVRVTVGDSSPELPIRRRDSSDMGGRGMRVVDALASASGATWNGQRNGDAGKSVWFELSTTS